MDSNLRVAWGSKAKLAKNCVFSWSRARYSRTGEKARMWGERSPMSTDLDFVLSQTQQTLESCLLSAHIESVVLLG